MLITVYQAYNSISVIYFTVLFISQLFFNVLIICYLKLKKKCKESNKQVFSPDALFRKTIVLISASDIY